MLRSARFLLVLLVVAFAATSVAQAASGSVMSLKMASAAVDGMASEMSDCAACPTDSDAGAVACDLLCNLSFSATLPCAVLAQVDLAGVDHVELIHGASCRATSPDPHPPRTPLLD